MYVKFAKVRRFTMSSFRSIIFPVQWTAIFSPIILSLQVEPCWQDRRSSPIPQLPFSISNVSTFSTWPIIQSAVIFFHVYFTVHFTLTRWDTLFIGHFTVTCTSALIIMSSIKRISKRVQFDRQMSRLEFECFYCDLRAIPKPLVCYWYTDLFVIRRCLN